MRINGSWEPPYPIDDVWAVLYDPDVLARHTPGCQSMEQTGPEQFALDLKVAVAGIGGRYQATLRRSDVQPPAHCGLKVEGRGPIGAIKVDGTIDLAPAGAGTKVAYGGDVAVAGAMAGVANRVMGGVAKMMLGQFFKDLEAELASRHAAAEPGEDQGRPIP